MERQPGTRTNRTPRPGGDRLDGADAVRVLDIIAACLDCGDEADFTALFDMIRKVLPFDCALVLAGRPDADGVSVTESRSIAFPERWIEAYAARLGPGRDGVVRAAMTAREVQSWSDARVRLAQPNALGLCRDFGLRSGHVAGLGPACAPGRGHLVCFGGASPTIDRRGEAVVWHLAPHLLWAFSRLGRVHGRRTAPCPVSPREREVLGWLAQGKSSWDISVILGIRERTVNFHVANIMRKLGTCNRAQTVAAALHRQLIVFD
ncbi:MAG: helix-turn-helix domain-containing protein [Solidesulfovibrio sp. DCME]|uniref:helix-turn-helix transcriptional regulator n=1 Tax=Solidesulfovibrio sp. DCME TaxID=3447380 RepID=UPI003D1415BD